MFNKSLTINIWLQVDPYWEQVEKRWSHRDYCSLVTVSYCQRVQKFMISLRKKTKNISAYKLSLLNIIKEIITSLMRVDATVFIKKETLTLLYLWHSQFKRVGLCRFER